jgi:cobalt-zinc-cadmium efflux system membrane fusion protein
VVAGQVVDTAKELFKVADTSRLWLFLFVPIEEASLVKPGQQVKFRPDAATEDVVGTVTWVSTAVDPTTRTVEVRANVDNSAGRLRAETFGTGLIVLREEPTAVVVPSEAVQWDGSCFVVFVRDNGYFQQGTPKFFHTRSVRPGVRTPAVTEIIAGLLPNEVVATKGSGILRAQLLRNNLGAG